MSISGIKLKIASKKAASRVREKDSSEVAAPVESVVVICDSLEDEVVSCFREMKEFLQVKDENFKMIFSVADRSGKQDGQGTFFKPADISWAGNLKGELQKIRDRRFDLLICFTKESNKPARFLSAVLDAGLKVGRQNSGSAVFDLSISTGPEEAEIFTQELRKYLRILNRIKE